MGAEHGRPQVWEIVGVAGAGKTTLARRLERYPNILWIDSLRDRCALHEVIRISISVLRDYVRLTLSKKEAQRGGGGNGTQRQLYKILARFRSIQYLVEKEMEKANYEVIILDQGPIYILTWLVMYGYSRSHIHDEKFGFRLRQEANNFLTGVVWLDEENEELFHRIKKREKAHRVKSYAIEDAFVFLDKYRETLREQLSELVGVRVIDMSGYLSRGASAVDEVELQVIEHLGLEFRQA